MQENNQPGVSSISHATTVEEMAEFWDTHDTADYWEQFEEVQINVTMRPRHRVVIEEETYARVAEEARRRAIRPETLINLWVAERLHTLAAAPRAGRASTKRVRKTVESAEKLLAEESEAYLTE
jgi:hypothetical protein